MAHELSVESVQESWRAIESPRRQILRRLSRNRAAMIGGSLIATFVVCAVLAPVIEPHDPITQNLSVALQGPSTTYLLGTDELGRDILSRLLAGARVSLAITGSAVGLALLGGTAIGITSGYFGGWVDSVLMRTMDVLLAIPGILLAITVIAILGLGLESLIIAIGVSSIPTFARLARSTTLASRHQEYVLAATTLGATNRRIMIQHILPNIVAPLIVQTSLRLGTAVLTASGLSFLGLGPQPPTPEWGAMLATGRSYLTSSPHVAVSPGVAIMLVVFGFNLLGDGLRDALNPRMKT